MTEKMKTTAPLSSVGADGAQPQLKNHSEIIANETAQINLQAAQNLETKNEILNSTSPTGSSVYFCTVDIYSFIHPWYGYLSF